MQPSENPLVVFVSSVQRRTVDDLRAERQATISEIRKLELTRPWAFEETPASSDPVDQSYLDQVRACDIFVMVLGKELTDPVEREWKEACAARKPRLVFVKRETERSDRLGALVDQINVKYDSFTDPNELRQRVKSAIIDEIVRGFRRYRIRDEDYRVLLETIRSSTLSFVVRTIAPEELPLVSGDFPELAELYPDWEEWIARKRVEIIGGAAEAYVSVYEGNNAGFALTSNKGERVRKLSTLYVLPEYQGLGTGPRLLYDVVVKAALDRIEKIYLTVSEERRSELEPLVAHYGFHVEGVSGRRYRSGSWEWIWSKRLVHGQLHVEQLPSFVRTHLLEERGFEVRDAEQNIVLARPRMNTLGLSDDTQQPFLVAVGDDTSGEEVYERAVALSRVSGLKLIFVGCDYPSNRRVIDLCIDAYDLEAMFFPLYIKREVGGLIVSIQERFAQQLIPAMRQQQFLTPTRTQLRTDNVYYRTAKQFSALKRGSPILFFETQIAGASSVLMGEAKLSEFAVDEPRELFARYGNLGVYTLDGLETTARGAPASNAGKVLGLKFDWYREFPRALTRQRVRTIIPTYNPIAARTIDCEETMLLRGAAGWNVTELSYL